MFDLVADCRIIQDCRKVEDVVRKTFEPSAAPSALVIFVGQRDELSSLSSWSNQTYSNGLCFPPRAAGRETQIIHSEEARGTLRLYPLF